MVDNNTDNTTDNGIVIVTDSECCVTHVIAARGAKWLHCLCELLHTEAHERGHWGQREKGGRKEIITEDNKGVPYVILLLLFLSVSLSNLEILRFLFLICKVVCERLSKSIICCCGCCS